MKIIPPIFCLLPLLFLPIESLQAAVIQSQIEPSQPPVSTVQGNTIIQNYPTETLDDNQPPSQEQEPAKVDREGKIPRNRLPQNTVPRKRVSQNKIPKNPLPDNKIPRQGLNRAKVPRNPLERNQIKSNRLPPTRIPDNKLPKNRAQDDRHRPIPPKDDT